MALIGTSVAVFYDRSTCDRPVSAGTVAAHCQAGSRVMTVLPRRAAQAAGASAQLTTDSTTGARSRPRASRSRTAGMSARALARPVTNRVPVVYIHHNGIPKTRSPKKMLLQVQTPPGHVARRV